MKHTVINCLLLLLIYSCSTTEDCDVDCETVPLKTCELNSGESQEILSSIIYSYKIVDVMLVQQTPVRKQGVSFWPIMEMCDTLITEELLIGLENLITEERSWCSERIKNTPVITNEEVDCYYSKAVENERFCFTDKYGARKFLRISEPYVLGERALVYLIDSDCSDELVVLSKQGGEWFVLCKRPISIC